MKCKEQISKPFHDPTQARGTDDNTCVDALYADPEVIKDLHTHTLNAVTEVLNQITLKVDGGNVAKMVQQWFEYITKEWDNFKTVRWDGGFEHLFKNEDNEDNHSEASIRTEGSGDISTRSELHVTSEDEDDDDDDDDDDDSEEYSNFSDGENELDGEDKSDEDDDNSSNNDTSSDLDSEEGELAGPLYDDAVDANREHDTIYAGCWNAVEGVNIENFKLVIEISGKGVEVIKFEESEDEDEETEACINEGTYQKYIIINAGKL